MSNCVIIPAYNEAKAIGGVIRAVKAYIHDVAVIDDGSTDNTVAIAKEAGAAVLRSEKNQGKGKALKTGFEYAVKNNYEAIVTMDGDGQHSPEDLLNLINGGAAPDVGVVVGNRMADPENMPPMRFITNLFMSFILSVVCRQNIPDTQCGFRLIKCAVLKGAHIISSNYEVESELLIKASKMGFKIISVPIKSVYTGQVSLINPFLDTWRFFIMLFKVFI